MLHQSVDIIDGNAELSVKLDFAKNTQVFWRIITVSVFQTGNRREKALFFIILDGAARTSYRLCCVLNMHDIPSIVAYGISVYLNTAYMSSNLAKDEKKT